MKTVSLFTALAIGLVGQFAQAQENIPDLRGTGWEGTYSILGQASPIRVGFAAGTNAKGETPYFGKVLEGGLISEVAGEVSVTCDRTPRALRLDSPTTGTLSVYTCAGSAAEEDQLAADANRQVAKSVKLKDIVLSEDGQTLSFTAKIIVNVRYVLHRKDLPKETAESREALRAWVVGQ